MLAYRFVFLVWCCRLTATLNINRNACNNILRRTEEKIKRSQEIIWEWTGTIFRALEFTHWYDLFIKPNNRCSFQFALKLPCTIASLQSSSYTVLWECFTFPKLKVMFQLRNLLEKKNIGFAASFARWK